MLDFLGHIFYVCVLAGTLLIGSKNKWGWIIRAVGESGWIVIGFALGMSSIWLWGFGFLAMELWNFYRWHNEDKLSQIEGSIITEALGADGCISLPRTSPGRCCKQTDGERGCGPDAEPSSSESVSGFR